MSALDLPFVAPFPRAIELQTTAACNAACIICPHPEVWAEGHRGRMTDDLFEKVLRECEAYQDDLRLIPYLNAEPFLDPQFLHRLRRINEVCPKAVVEVSTNLSRLDQRVRSELAALRIDDLRLSLFGITEETHRKLMPGLRWRDVWQNLTDLIEDQALRRAVGAISLIMIEHPDVPADEYQAAAAFCARHGVRFNHWGFLDRSGNVRLFSNGVFHERVAGCEQHRPLERLHVQFNGDVILCCQDWRASVVLGNLREQSIQQVWNAEGYVRVRQAIYRGGLTQPDVCLRCKGAVPG